MQLGVLLVEPDNDLRYWVGRLVERSEGFTLQASCSRADDLESMVERFNPQIIMLDYKTMAGLDPGFMARLKSRLPAPYVALTGHQDEKSMQKLAIRAGADGFFDQSRAPQSLLNIRQGILAGHHKVAGQPG